MKHAKKLASLLLALVMVLGLATTAFAQEFDVASDEAGSITISNAAKGETYTIYKLFDATVTGTEGGSIAYQGEIPAALTAYFTKDSAGNIFATDAAWKDPATKAEMSEGLRTALTEWAETATATATVVSDGSKLTFQNVEYGYYVVTTTQGETAISVDSTNPTVTIVDKNSTVPKELTKTADSTDVNIGDTVTYTVTFKTANYDGAGEAAKKVVTYVIEDTLPDFLKDVTVTSIIVDNDGDAATTDDQTNVTAQFNNKKIEIDWYDDVNAKFLYDNGASITIIYTAVVTDSAAIDGEGNTNKVTVSWVDEDGTTPGEGDKLTEEETIYTYAIAIKKVDDKGTPLANAKFRLPFYVKETPAADDGAYIYAGTTAGDGLTNEVTTPANGLIVIKGVKTGTYSITETEAPAGFNLLTDSFEVTAVKTGSTTTTTTTYLDENGNVTETETQTKVEVTLDNISAAVKVVVNKTGAELPSTGGMGTTLFYVIGGLLVACAAVLLVVKKRMKHAEH
jgi:LPXTG-motif cell wall-anchored protein